MATSAEISTTSGSTSVVWSFCRTGPATLLPGLALGADYGQLSFAVVTAILSRRLSSPCWL